jgi:hypothetical protein
MTHLATKFWMVWSPSGRAPTYKHDTRESANNEARRLSKACPSQQFFVLKAMGGFQSIPVVPDAPEVIQMVDDPIPF